MNCRSVPKDCPVYGIVPVREAIAHSIRLGQLQFWVACDEFRMQLQDISGCLTDHFNAFPDSKLANFVVLETLALNTTRETCQPFTPRRDIWEELVDRPA